MIKGTEIGLRIDQTLTQDYGTMAYLQFEAMEYRQVKPSVHSLISTTTRSSQALKMPMTTTEYIGSVAKTRNLFLVGNICHQCQAFPASLTGTLSGSDSHTPTGGVWYLAMAQAVLTLQ